MPDHLVITADDFGLAPEVNEAVEKAHRAGLLSAASLMVAGEAAADAVGRARRLPGLRVGLHLVVADGRPTLPPERLPGLVDRDGRLRRDLVRLAWELALRPSLRRRLASEIAAQFEAFAATRLPLDHVNAHRHFHLHPVVGNLVIGIGRRYGMRALRVPIEPPSVLGAADPPGPAGPGRLLRPWQGLLRARARRAGLVIPDAVLGLAWSGNITAARLCRLLDHLPPGLIEIYLHPATADRFAGSAPGYRYVDELSALTDARCLRALYAAKRRPAGYADLAFEEPAGRSVALTDQSVRRRRGRAWPP